MIMYPFPLPRAKVFPNNFLISLASELDCDQYNVIKRKECIGDKRLEEKTHSGEKRNWELELIF